MDNRKFYIAYGSNLNMEQMLDRCPKAEVYASGELRDYELLFKGDEDGVAYATVEPRMGGVVPVGVWTITPRCERALDGYEGFPDFYYKKTVTVQTNRGAVEGLIYIMDESYPVALPERYYVDICLDGYDDFHLNKAVFRAALHRNLLRAAE